MEHERAVTAEDVVWRRSKLGLRMSADQTREPEEFLQPSCPRTRQTASAALPAR